MNRRVLTIFNCNSPFVSDKPSNATYDSFFIHFVDDFTSLCDRMPFHCHKTTVVLLWYCTNRTTSEKTVILTTFDYIILLFHRINSDRCQVLRVQLNKQCLISSEREAGSTIYTEASHWKRLRYWPRWRCVSMWGRYNNY